ncbi:MAG: CopD family protein, partial [Candidatus Bathyarchaeia archaeon]
GSVMKRFRPLVYLSIVTFLFSGIAMTLLDENYLGFLDLSTPWAVVMLIKHVIVGIFIYLAIYSFEGLAPKVAEVAAKGPSPELARLQRLQMRGAKIGLGLGIVILLLTGIATAL